MLWFPLLAGACALVSVRAQSYQQHAHYGDNSYMPVVDDYGRPAPTDQYAAPGTDPYQSLDEYPPQQTSEHYLPPQNRYPPPERYPPSQPEHYPPPPPEQYPPQPEHYNPPPPAEQYPPPPQPDYPPPPQEQYPPVQEGYAPPQVRNQPPPLYGARPINEYDAPPSYKPADQVSYGDDALPFYQDPYLESSGYFSYNDDKLTLPSMTSYAGYIPREIMHFRELFKTLRLKYPNLPLLSPEDFVNDPQIKKERTGRVLPLSPLSFLLPLFGPVLGGGAKGGIAVGGGGGGGGGGLANGLFGGLANLMGGKGIFPAALQDAVTGKTDAPLGALEKFYDLDTDNGETFETNINYYTGKDMANSFVGTACNASYDGIEPCRNGQAVCVDCATCTSSGGVAIGNCQKGNCCCQYIFDRDEVTDATISYFQTLNFPESIRDSLSMALSLNVRPDVDQILVEFVSFELPVTPYGCTDADYLEVISPEDAGGILGNGNSKFCGINTDQHFYLHVNPGDTVIFKILLSGTGFVPFKKPPSPNNKKDYHFRTGASRFQLKITQLLKPMSFTGQMASFTMFDNLMQMKTKGNDKKGVGQMKDALKSMKKKYGQDGFCGVVPAYYEKLRTEPHCTQHFKEIRGTFQNFNFDGKTCMPPNLNYEICFDQPSNFCGLTLSALQFDIPVREKGCMSGANYSDGKCACCTGGFIGRKGPVTPGQITKYLGVSGTSDGKLHGSSYAYNQPRYFFCGANMGKTNFVVSQMRGPTRVQVYSDHHDCTVCENYVTHGVGFKIKYALELGAC